MSLNQENPHFLPKSDYPADLTGNAGLFFYIFNWQFQQMRSISCL